MGLPSGVAPEPAALTWAKDLRSADGLFISDERQRIVFWSPSAEEILDHPADTVLGRPCYEVMAGKELNGHPICRRNCRVVMNARRGRPTPAYDVVTRNRRGDMVCLNASIILSGGGPSGHPYMLHLFRARPSGHPTFTTQGSAARPKVVPPVGRALSRREFEVLRLLASGRSTSEIAKVLSISRYTARNHINRTEQKLGARDRLEAVVLGAHHGLI